ncbi:MAG: family 16 glycosylhydrolase [Saprospiraceae bacterium]|nr:family 16 glycosylhydrolase [Saprospiraceae bacterium]
MKYTDMIPVRSRYTLLLALLMLTMAPYGCIDEDDGTPGKLNLPVVTIADYSIREGDVDQVLQLEVLLSGENKTNAIVTFSAISVTAEPNLDYEVITSGQLIFAPDENKKVIEITIIGDEAKETKETFQVKLYNPMNTYIEKDLSTITIDDDDDNTAGLVIPSGGYQSPESYDGYTLKWADEFDGETLNTADWTFEIGDGCPNNCGWGNNELQYYREDNTSIVDGHLVITAKEQNFGNHDYTSSRLVTKGKRQFKFGRIDIRAALPEGKGLWPALWMLGSNVDAVGWPASGEIDIMELTGDLPNRVVGTVHYGANLGDHQQNTNALYLSGTDNFQDAFHVFSINWENNLIEFLVDDVVFHTITPASLNGATYPFNKNFFFIFNVAVGGNFPGSPDSSTPFPQHMIVDYIRVFQK